MDVAKKDNSSLRVRFKLGVLVNCSSACISILFIPLSRMNIFLADLEANH